MTHYDTLGVDKDTSPEDLKKAYRAKVAKAHPDHGGDPEDVRTIIEAFTVLSDPDKRDSYDRGKDPQSQTIASPGEKVAAVYLDKQIEKMFEHNVGDLIARTRSAIRTPLAHYQNLLATATKDLSICVERLATLLAKNPPAADRTIAEDVLRSRVRLHQGYVDDLGKEVKAHEDALDIIDGLRCPAVIQPPTAWERELGGTSQGRVI